MSDIAIRVENLSKRYRIGLKEEQHDTTSTALSAGLAGALTDWLKRPAHNLRRLRRLTHFDDGRPTNDHASSSTVNLCSLAGGGHGQ